MQTNLGWVFRPDVNVLAAELKDGTWQVSVCGHGGRACPGCGTCATARHGWQHRRLQDLPMQGARVTLNLRLGRWRCRSPHCKRQTFTDRLTAIAAPLARRTCRLTELVRRLGHTAGSRPGERLMAPLNLPVSDSTILRQLKRHPEVETISRDRCGLYAQGAHQAAPQARQVADRFHLLQNGPWQGCGPRAHTGQSRVGDQM